MRRAPGARLDDGRAARPSHRACGGDARSARLLGSPLWHHVAKPRQPIAGRLPQPPTSPADEPRGRPDPAAPITGLPVAGDPRPATPAIRRAPPLAPPPHIHRSGLAGKRGAHKEVLKTLGLRRRLDRTVLPNTPAVRGALARVPHLVDVSTDAAHAAEQRAFCERSAIRPPLHLPHREAGRD